ncbi:uncharacterized protein LOC114574179 [Exaiptasia diaphana]|uniref:Endonuclease/exonuclease/phosphatase domain-containing protein n=1 Tax=Exaiptasia diaphana TaxID=2652724 RepID=A0A913XGK3_EXADI|nr:uncharacterized protein LOC114574179 [Exaiptasia diaphana]
MSLAPKIDEVRSVVQDENVDLVCVTETWLREHIENNIINISGYNIIRRNRVESQHGGVCIYVRNSIHFTVLDTIMDQNFEVLWIKLRPNQLPRGISSIIIGIVYHPQSANDQMMKTYLYDSLSNIEAQYPDSGIIVLGDFNQLNIARLKYSFSVKQIVPFPTRGKNKLDLILTNLSLLYDTPMKFPFLAYQTMIASSFNHFSVKKSQSVKYLLSSEILDQPNDWR